MCKIVPHCRAISSQLRHVLTIGKNVLTRMWVNANVMAALPNIGGGLCSTTQSVADAHY